MKTLFMQTSIKIENFYPKKMEREVYDIESEPLRVKKTIETKYSMAISSQNNGRYFYMRFDEYPSGPYEIFLAGSKLASGYATYNGQKDGVRYWSDGTEKNFSYSFATQLFTILIDERKTNKENTQ
jgi:hypothetical protein